VEICDALIITRLLSRDAGRRQRCREEIRWNGRLTRRMEMHIFLQCWEAAGGGMVDESWGNSAKPLAGTTRCSTRAFQWTLQECYSKRIWHCGLTFWKWLGYVCVISEIVRTQDLQVLRFRQCLTLARTFIKVYFVGCLRALQYCGKFYVGLLWNFGEGVDDGQLVMNRGQRTGVNISGSCYRCILRLSNLCYQA
jgi:hypothetical protein